MAENDTDLDRQIDKLAKDFASGARALSGNPIVQAGLLSPLIAHLVMALEDEFSSCRDVILDALESQADVLKLEAKQTQPS